jgi:hypothetical protein
VPSGGSLTADQWLLLATVYGPIVVRASILFSSPLLIVNLQVPQLWASSLLVHGGNDVLTRRVSSIAEIEAEKDREAARKVEDRKALADAKEHGKEAVAAVKARIAQDRAASAEAIKVEKLRVAAEQQVEKAMVAAEKKAKQAEQRVRAQYHPPDVY